MTLANNFQLPNRKAQEQIQEKTAAMIWISQKIPGTENLADALTKYYDMHVLNHHVKNTYQTVSSLKHPLTPST